MLNSALLVVLGTFLVSVGARGDGSQNEVKHTENKSETEASGPQLRFGFGFRGQSLRGITVAGPTVEINYNEIFDSCDELEGRFEIGFPELNSEGIDPDHVAGDLDIEYTLKERACRQKAEAESLLGKYFSGWQTTGYLIMNTPFIEWEYGISREGAFEYVSDSGNVFVRIVSGIALVYFEFDDDIPHETYGVGRSELGQWYFSPHFKAEVGRSLGLGEEPFDLSLSYRAFWKETDPYKVEYRFEVGKNLSHCWGFSGYIDYQRWSEAHMSGFVPFHGQFQSGIRFSRSLGRRCVEKPDRKLIRDLEHTFGLPATVFGLRSND